MRENIGPVMMVAGLAIFVVSLFFGAPHPENPPLAFYILCPIGLSVAMGSVYTHLVLNDKK